MKLFIASDIHGSAAYCKRILDAYEKEHADRLILLGDTLYHGPRNPQPEKYCPADVAKMLTAYKEKIIYVKGNCDSEVDQCVLPFPIMSGYAEVLIDGLRIVLSHGHLAAPPMSAGDVYITGHTHVQLNVDEDGVRHLNPGSPSLPKEYSKRAYIVYENRTFTFKTLNNGKEFDSVTV